MKNLLKLIAAGVFLTACTAQDPYVREGMWRPTGANDRNLRTMVAAPEDLVSGAADPRADGQVIAAAVARYRAGKVKDLPESSASRISPISISTGGGAAATSDGN